MIKVAEELIKAMHSRQELVEVAQVVLAELTGLVSHTLERLRDRNSLGGDAERRSRLPDRRQAGADRQFSGYEVRSPGGATRFGIIVGEAHALVGHPIKIRRPAGHDALI